MTVGGHSNILLVVVDCLRADALEGSAAGRHAPHVAAFVREGVSFGWAFAASSTTSPCFASILTGLYPAGHGIRSLRDHRLAEACPTLAEALRAAGYATRALVSGPLRPSLGLDRGFDRYEHRDKEATVYGPFGASLQAAVAELRQGGPRFLLAHLFELHRPRRLPPVYDRPAYGKNRYHRALAGLDAYLGALLDGVDLDRTLVVLTGDHGESLGERAPGPLRRLLGRLTGRKRSPLEKVGHGFHVYDILTHIPLVIRGAGLRGGRRANALVSQVDLAPTLLDLAGLPWPGSTPGRGRSLVPSLRGDSLPERPVLLEACGRSIEEPADRLLGIRTEEWKYVCAPGNPSIPEELYHLSHDPAERRNLAARSPERTAAMRSQLEALLAEARRAGPAAPETMSALEQAEMEAQLRSLGYLES